jgi:ArpU family phage transcriptional regulator
LRTKKNGKTELLPLFPCTKKRPAPLTGYQSTTERMAVEKVTKEVKIQQIEKSLEILTEWERQYIEEKYFSSQHPSDYEVCAELGISRRTITRIKTPAILKVATALNIPQAEECLTEILLKKWA